MAAEDFVQLPGDVVPREELCVPKARCLAELLSGEYPFTALIECRLIVGTGGDEAKRQEIVIFDVEVEISQRPINDIRRIERIAVGFLEDDHVRPEVLTLRADFPVVPHLNVTPWEKPRSICLSDLPYTEDKLGWTSAGFVERIRRWLALTAAGELHQGDQALEPLLGGVAAKIILPYDLFREADGSPEAIVCRSINQGEAGDVRRVIIAERDAGVAKQQQARPFVAIPLGVTAPMTHGIIRWQPDNLAELHAFLQPAGKDLLADLRRQLRLWEGDPAMLARKPIFIIGLQKRRADDGPVEVTETWAFLADKTLQEIQVAIGVHAEAGGYTAVLLTQDDTRNGEDVGLGLMLPYYTLSRESAALYNEQLFSNGMAIVAIGLGALGSQVFDNLVRCGFGQWTLIDDDHMLPHNLARHELHGETVGFSKVAALSTYANATIAGPPIAVPLLADVLEPGGQSEALAEVYRSADLLLDMSASVAVARHLACDSSDVNARRASLFLNPSGSDLVLLAEDAERRQRLDALEMQYYRALVESPDLVGHLRPPGGRLRYGRSCRDVSRTLPQDLVALHAAIGSRAVRQAVENPHAQIRIWRSSDIDLAVRCVNIPVAPGIERILGDWTLVTDAALVERVQSLRMAKLPVETGGVLIGAFDTQRRIVYVADVVPSPPDSVERTDLYIRGSLGLREEVERIAEMTARSLRYVGEWHSHPRGFGVAPSDDDRKLFGWLSDLMAQEGLPPLMLIVGEAELGWYLELDKMVARAPCIEEQA